MRRPLIVAALIALAPAAARADLWDRVQDQSGPPPPKPVSSQGSLTRDPLVPSAPAPGRVRLGATAPLTGPKAGDAVVLRVAKALLERTGLAEVVLEDDGAVPFRTLSAARHLEEAWRVVAFLSPMESAPLTGLAPYLKQARTPTLFLPAGVAGWVGPNVLALPPSGAALTRALLDEAAKRAEELRSRGWAVGRGVVVVAATTEDAEDRLSGLSGARLADVAVLRASPNATSLQVSGPQPAVLLVLGPPSLAVVAAQAARQWATGCSAAANGSTCAVSVLALSLTEPWRWEDLGDPALVGAITADWLPVDRADWDRHAATLRAAGVSERPSRLTLWGHALAELTEAVLRRAGTAADGRALLRAARGLGRWDGAVLREVSLGPDDPWAVRRARMVTLGQAGPQAEATWLTLSVR